MIKIIFSVNTKNCVYYHMEFSWNGQCIVFLLCCIDFIRGLMLDFCFDITSGLLTMNLIM